MYNIYLELYFSYKSSIVISHVKYTPLTFG